jgi:prevent-host-death family protein
MIAISIEEMERNLRGYMSQVEAGETLVVTRAGQPVAEIKPVSPSPSTDSGPKAAPGKKQLRPYGLAKGEFEVPADFDDPLPEDILRLFEGGEE